MSASATSASLAAEKVAQAAAVLREKNIDLWLTFVRETGLTPDPAVDLILGGDLTWTSALLIPRDGRARAIVGHFDTGLVEASGAYAQVTGYHEDVRSALRAQLAELDPRTIALNYSTSDAAADGLTHGLYRLLHELLEGTAYPERFVSAEEVIAAVRGRKSPAEVARLRAAGAATGALVAALSAWLRPGLSEREIAAFVHARAAEAGHPMAWSADSCPIVTAGPESPVGHGGPGDFVTRPGTLLHLDLGLRVDGYCSDLQRMWYFLADGEQAPPPDVQAAFDAVRATIEAGRTALRPGAQGWEVDAAGRAAITAAGYPEYRHALGHHLGRAVHDGATVLGPRWPRYGRTPFGIVEEHNVFTLELGVAVPGRGFVGLEEDVLVTAGGVEYLGEPQTALYCVG
jgi:Xaa-Pro aminopeptidase